MKPLKVLLLFIPSAAILFVLAIVTILFTPLSDEINEFDIRIHLSERVKRITKIDMPKNAKVIEIKSASSFFGEGYSSIVLELTSQETQAFIEKIKNHPDWKWKFDYGCLSAAEKERLNHLEQVTDLYKQKNSYSRNKIEEGFDRYARLCQKQNILRLSESGY
ncbi:hypothetical protein [Floridanema evergladense]|uniref:Uncharacterized protein n=1 Tax=Floridaenema evergladense BLCC-F167 TaxID=3153639 RepID=A0ABV4WL88_9CYAN